MEFELDQFTGFQWDEGNINKNLYKHKVENWECEQVFFNEPLIILDDPKHSYAEKRWAAFGKTDARKLLTGRVFIADANQRSRRREDSGFT